MSDESLKPFEGRKYLNLSARYSHLRFADLMMRA